MKLLSRSLLAMALTHGPVLALAAETSSTATEPPEKTMERISVSAEPSATGAVDGFVAKRATTASKSDVPLLEVPRAVSVVTADEMRNRAADDLTEVFQYTAGINGDSYGGNSLSRVYSNVRGFLTYQYLDGLKLHDSNWGIEPFGLERAELFKGPGSSLYGQGSPGGIINMISKRPATAGGGEFAVQGGSFNRLQGAADFTGPVGRSGKLAYRLTALARDAETRVKHTQDDRYYIAPALTWLPTERTEITVLGSFQSDPNLTMFQYLPRVGTLTPSAYGFIPRDTFTGEPDYDDISVERRQIGYLLRHEFTSSIAFSQGVRYTDIDITANYLQAGALASDQRTVSRTRVRSGYDIEVLQLDNQLHLAFDTGRVAHAVVAGIDYASIPTVQISGSAAGPTLDLYQPVYGSSVALPAITADRDQDFEQLGFYAQDQLKVGLVSLLVGLRHDDASSDTTTLNPVTGVVSPTVSQDDAATTGQAGVALNFAHGIAPYANYAKSFQPTSGSDFFGNPFVPTTGKQVELGVKYQPAGFNALLSAAVFDLVQQNVRTNDLAHAGYSIQTGEITAKGFELEGKASIAQALNVSAAYTYLDNKVTRSTTTNLNKRPQGRPLHQASLWADYALPVVSGVVVGGGVRYVGASFGDSTNTFEVPAYTLLDILLRYDFNGISSKLDGWNLSANASNVTDKRYVANCDAATQCFYGQGRTVKVTVGRRW